MPLEPARFCRTVGGMASSPDAPSDDDVGPDDVVDDVRDPARPFADVEIPPVPMTAQGAPVPGFLGAPVPLPPVDARSSICLRDCRYYWQMNVHMDIGNTEETFDPVIGLRNVIQCPTCKGKRGRLVAPALASSPALACGYIPSQGRYAPHAADGPGGSRLVPDAGYPCRLERDHACAHHHDPALAPAPRPEVCPRCRDKGYVVDPQSAVVTVPRRTVRSCLRQDGVDVDLTDTIVYDCTEWDPRGASQDNADRASRRRSYLYQHPELVTIRTRQE